MISAISTCGRCCGIQVVMVAIDTGDNPLRLSSSLWTVVVASSCFRLHSTATIFYYIYPITVIFPYVLSACWACLDCTVRSIFRTLTTTDPRGDTTSATRAVARFPRCLRDRFSTATHAIHIVTLPMAVSGRRCGHLWFGVATGTQALLDARLHSCFTLLRAHTYVALCGISRVGDIFIER